MSNKEHASILKQGVEAWNSWRRDNPDIQPDLRGESFIGADLSEMYLGRALLNEVILSGANLMGTNLIEADLRWADLSGVDLQRADLRWADLQSATLLASDLSEAGLQWADLSGAYLLMADLRDATVGWTIFGNVDLSVVKGLEAVRHDGPSTIGIDTICQSKGNIPEAFLRGAGVPDSFIEYIASLVGRPIQFYSCFISYSSKDQDAAKRLHADLQSKGIRCWFAPEDMKTGDRIRARIDQTIRLHDKLLLILSRHSIESDWVEAEVETALEEERKRKRTVLFPIRLDDSVEETEQAWAAHIRRTRHIRDFRRWKDHDAYQEAFARLVRDLEREEG